MLLDFAPEIYFFLQYTPHSPYSLFQNPNGEWNAKREGKKKVEILHSESSIAFETLNWISSLDLENIEILYVYGIGLGACYDTLKTWLNQEGQRRLVFLEEDLGVFAVFTQQEIAHKILQDPQVLVRYVQNWEEEIENLTQKFPYAHVEVTALPFYAKKYKQKFSDLKMRILRRTASYHALFSEALFSHKLASNVAKNLQRLPSCFYANALKDRFEGVPAIICGAGPSLQTAIKTLKELENKALIFAGGSAISSLSNQGVYPHFSMALDPNPEEVERLRAASCFETPLLFSSRLHPGVFSTCNSPLGYLKSDTGGLFERWMEERLSIEEDPVGPDLGGEAFSVTTLAVSYAYLLGCNPIILAGVDLAYTDKLRYAPGVMPQKKIDMLGLKQDKRATDRLLKRKDRNGKTVYTRVLWVMESDALSSYAKAHSERTFLNVTPGGIGFSDIPYLSLEEAVKTHCRCTWDLRGKVHTELQERSMGAISPGRIDALYEQLRLSLRRSLDLCEEILSELAAPTAKKIVLELDLQEEVAYGPLLELPLHALDQLLARYVHETPLEREKIKWHRLKEVIEHELQTLSE